MHYQIRHTTTYHYDRPVELEPHMVRLRPRSAHDQTLLAFRLEITPEPLAVTQRVDLDGNVIVQLRFNSVMEQLRIEAISEVKTDRTNPFDFFLEPWAVKLPIDYPMTLLSQLKPYLDGSCPPYGYAMDPVAMQLAQEIAHQTHGNTVSFLGELNQRIYQTCQYETRETGDPLPPSLTWQYKSGSCRDFVVLWMAVCRAAGLAARFVSGYEEGDPEHPDRHLHAWAEVYLPGAGWRGYDPTHGLAVTDRHIALVSSAFPLDCAPVSGKIRTMGVQSHMAYDLSIQKINSHGC